MSSQAKCIKSLNQTAAEISELHQDKREHVKHLVVVCDTECGQEKYFPVWDWSEANIENLTSCDETQSRAMHSELSLSYLITFPSAKENLIWGRTNNSFITLFKVGSSLFALTVF